MSEKVMLTTIDNPYNPFTDYANWLTFDKLNDHNTCEWIARLSTDSEALSEEEENEEQLKVFQRIIDSDFEGIYYLVSEKDSNKLISLSKPHEL